MVSLGWMNGVPALPGPGRTVRENALLVQIRLTGGDKCTVRGIGIGLSQRHTLHHFIDFGSDIGRTGYAGQHADAGYLICQNLNSLVVDGKVLEVLGLHGIGVDRNRSESLCPFHNVVGGGKELQKGVGAPGMGFVLAEAGKVVA